ncbi:MAG TPA: serine hydrolase domain-containing protein [Thermomicrobiales bacterium]|nr:serine hydrolase domain-containing protein [Thermomicrobiales bacterium]
MAAIPTQDIDAVFADWDRDDSPGCALAVVREGEIAYARGYGMSNLEHGVPITPGSIFHVASISKQFTDMCIALLASEGALSLDDDIRQYVPEIPDYGETITIRHLIHHTSGLRDMWSLLRMAGWRADDLINETDMLWVASRQAAPNFRPGDEYLYSNTGYALLALIIHRVSGKTLRQFAHERIFEPLGMTSTHVHDDHTEIVKGRTQAYEPRKGGGLRISIPVFDVAGTTSLFTTVEDMARWDDNFHQHTVGGAAILEQMQTPGRLNDGGPMTYGFGLNIHSYRGLPLVEHSGADAGYRAQYLHFPEERLAVVCLCNLSTMTPRTLALAVADIMLGDQFPEPVYDETLEPGRSDASLAGVYRNEDTGDLLRITSDDEGLAIGFGHLQRLERLRGGTFRIEGQRLTRLRFEELDGRRALVFGALYSPQPDPVFMRVAEPELTEPRPFDGGEFHSDEVDATYRLQPDGDALRMTHYRLDEKTLQHAYDDVYASDDLRLELERDVHGSVAGFRASTGRVRGVWFARR